VAAGVGYLRDVRAWERFGFGSRGNLIVYAECLVFAAGRHALLNSFLNVPETLKESLRASRFELGAREQLQFSDDELVGRDRHNWRVRREEVERVVLKTVRGGGGAGGGDDLVSVVLAAGAAAVGTQTEQTLMISLTSRKTRTYPYVKGVWGDDQNDLLRRALGDKLVSA
jgi:hypothetical protein